MKSKKKILVLTDDMPWGHRSIAKAIYGYLKENERTNGYEVEYREIKANTGIAGDLYTFAYRYMPKTNKVAHLFFKQKFARELMEEVSIVNLPNLKKEIEEFNPDLVISTYFFHTHSLAKWRKRDGKNFKLWTVVADPWTINPISFVNEADLNIVYDEVGYKEGIKYGLKKDQLMVTGWWTRQSMYEKYNYMDSRKKLGFRDDRPVVFVGGGSLGTSALPRLLPSILVLDKKVGLVINTGVDKFSFKLVEQFVKILKKLGKDKMIEVKHLGWIENMTEVLSACNIVLGKAGPNFLFDCVACKKPFVAITHIGGQEDGNIDLIKRKKLGWIKEKNGEAESFLKDYLSNPRKFENKFLKNITLESQKNKKTLPLILERIKKDLF